MLLQMRPYGRSLIGSYHSKVIQPNVNTVVRDSLFVLYVHDEAKSLGCNDHLFVGSGTLDTEAVVGRRYGVRFLLNLVLSSFDGFIIEDDLSQFVLVVGWHGHLDELTLVL